MTAGLDALEAQLRRELMLTRHPEMAWMPERPGPGGAHLYDVVVAGAGQGGLVTAFQLLRERVPNILVIDKAECCLLYTSPSPRDGLLSRMPSSA